LLCSLKDSKQVEKLRGEFSLVLSLTEIESGWDLRQCGFESRGGARGRFREGTGFGIEGFLDLFLFLSRSGVCLGFDGPLDSCCVMRLELWKGFEIGKNGGRVKSRWTLCLDVMGLLSLLITLPPTSSPLRYLTTLARGDAGTDEQDYNCDSKF
jgi:hypothetical protein